MSAIVLPDVRGLQPFYERLTYSFAEAGFDSVALDYYGRTAGTDMRTRSFNWRPHLPKVRPEHVHSDVATVASLLREDGGGAVFTVGFCFGGGHSWRLAASDLDLAGAIGLYGLPYLVNDVIDELAVPLLMLLVGHDAETPRVEYDHLVTKIHLAGKSCETHVYERAPHSFFDRTCSEWQEECADAWRRMLAFMARNGTAGADHPQRATEDQSRWI